MPMFKAGNKNFYKFCGKKMNCLVAVIYEKQATKTATWQQTDTAVQRKTTTRRSASIVKMV